MGWTKSTPYDPRMDLPPTLSAADEAFFTRLIQKTDNFGHLT